MKFGQVLSTRRDLIPADIAAELALSPAGPRASFPSEQAAQCIEAALGAPPATLFKHFEVDPVASASIAQVHFAVLTTAAKSRSRCCGRACWTSSKKT